MASVTSTSPEDDFVLTLTEEVNVQCYVFKNAGQLGPVEGLVPKEYLEEEIEADDKESRAPCTSCCTCCQLSIGYSLLVAPLLVFIAFVVLFFVLLK